jgi:hypothetical protein
MICTNKGSYIDNGDSYWDNVPDTTQDYIDADNVSYSVSETMAKAQKRPFFPAHIWNNIPVDVGAEILKHDWSASSNSDNNKLKGVGPLEFHLGTSYGRDPDGTLYGSAHRYIEKMVDSYTNTLFPGEKLNTKLKSALPKNDHPELDDSPL